MHDKAYPFSSTEIQCIRYSSVHLILFITSFFRWFVSITMLHAHCRHSSSAFCCCCCCLISIFLSRDFVALLLSSFQPKKKPFIILIFSCIFLFYFPCSPLSERERSLLLPLAFFLSASRWCHSFPQPRSSFPFICQHTLEKILIASRI